MKRLLSIFLIIAMLLTVLLSCGKSDEPKSDGKPTDAAATNAAGDVNAESNEEDDTAEEVIKANLPEADYNGYEFTILTLNDEFMPYPLRMRDLVAEVEVTGEPISEAVYKRNTIVEDMYNIKLKVIPFPESSATGPYYALKNSINAGDALIMYQFIYCWNK